MSGIPYGVLEILEDPAGAPRRSPSPPVRGFRPGGHPGGGYRHVRPGAYSRPVPTPAPSPPVRGFRPGSGGAGGAGGFARVGVLGVTTAFVAGYALGTAIDRRFGLSTGIANWLYRRDMEFRPARAHFQALRAAGRPTPSTTWARGAFR